ncbi:type II toxin-antitoxin system VapC family toxin [Cellulosimicrobium terreum]|nr:type II toxin-antitoxin system VapC family toxin [Cellulosimicrobium terreum]
MSGPLVVDASAVLALLVDPGVRGDRVARQLQGVTVLDAPDLLPYEVDNVLRRRRAAGLLAERDAQAGRDAFALLRFQLWPFAVLAARAWELGANLSTYDASYVALAEHVDGTLLTGDARISRAAGVRCAIQVV